MGTFANIVDDNLALLGLSTSSYALGRRAALVARVSLKWSVLGAVMQIRHAVFVAVRPGDSA